MLALVDANNFYVSCERVFNPRLERKPVIILSSNDGCAISRSMEAKALGIRMGEPWFKVKHKREFRDVVALSTNFELYGELSARVMRVLARHTPRQEVYSVDECFLDFSHLSEEELLPYARQMRAQVLQWVGIPVAVGIAPTKTLAKLSAERAKRAGLPAWLLHAATEAEVRDMPVSDIWGIGPASSRKLVAAGYSRVGQLVGMPLVQAAKLGGSALSKAVAEVQGVACLEIRSDRREPKQIISSRSFGQPILELATLQSAIRAFVQKSAQRLRRNGMATRDVVVYAVAKFPDGTKSTFTQSHAFTRPVAEVELLQAVSQKLAAAVYRSNLTYVKAGVMLLDLDREDRTQGALFEDESTDVSEQLAQAATLMNQVAPDQIRDAERLRSTNRLLAIEGVQPASDLAETWRPRSENLTPAYTSNWRALPVASTMKG